MTFTLGKFKSIDVFTMATLLSKIGLGKISETIGVDNLMDIGKKIKGAGKTADANAIVGMQMALQIAEILLGNLDKCEKELFTLLSRISGLSVDEVKDLDAEIFAQLIIEVIQLEQFKDFFKAASRLLNTAK